MSLPSYIGRYEIRGEIAQGGFATVLKGWDEELESFVALKIIHAELSDNKELHTRFLDEARLLRRVRSPNVITVHDVGRLSDGRPYLVMDYADRKTLSDRLDVFKDRAADNQSISVLVDALAEGLSAIHDAGVVHRDIKPANILLQSLHWVQGNQSSENAETLQFSTLILPRERIVIGDLGIAKDLVKDAGQFTIVGGTPLYQPPEQIEANTTVTPSADIYATTALLFQCLTGGLPPQAHAIKERLTDLPEGWRDVVAQGMAINPQDRFISIDSWRSAVQDVLASQAAVAQDDVPTELLVVSTDCPYKGLAAYQPEDAENFFGRDRLIDELVRRLQIERVLLVGGPSGSGKSSLVRAGLLPAIKAGALPGSSSWPVVLMTPGRDPLAELHDQIVAVSGHDLPSLSLQDLREQPVLARRLGRTQSGHRPMIIFIDQFEELFTLAPEDCQDNFIEALSALTDPADSQIKLIITIRADFYDSCARLPWLAERISDNQVLVGPMTDSELRRAITEPARRSGYYLERNLVDTIVEEAQNEAGSLPLVGHALVETWIRRKGNTLTLDGFRAAGGVTGAISQTADDTYENRFDAQEKMACHRLFLRLVTSREGGQDTRRIVSRSDLENDSEAETLSHVVDTLTQARLLTVDQTSVQITHEALLHTWPRLRGWIEESRDDLRFRQRITRASLEWKAEERNEDLLYRGTPLLSASDWVEKNPDQLDQLEREFVDASIEARQLSDSIAAEGRRRGRRLRRGAITVLAALAIGATAASVIAFRAYKQSVMNEQIAQHATGQARQSFGRSLGAVAKGLVREDPLLALALALEGMARTDEKFAGFDARSAMLEARQMLAGNAPVVLGSPLPAGDAISIAMNSAGDLVAVGLRDGAIRMFDLRHYPVKPLDIEGHGGGVEDIDFSNNAKRLASVSSDGALKIWDVPDDRQLKLLAEANSGDVLWHVEFDPQDKTVATAGENGTVQLWSANNAIPSGDPILKRRRDFLSVLFGTSIPGLVVGNGNGEVLGVKLPGGEPAFQPVQNAHSSDVWEVALSPDGQTIATSSSDGTSALIDFASGKVVGRAFETEANVTEVAFSTDGSMLIGASSKGNLQLWDLAEKRVTITSAVGHSRPIIGMKTSRQGNRIASLGADQQVRLWSFQEPRPLYQDYRLKDAKAKAVAVSPDGKLMVVGSESGVASLWRLDVRKIPQKLEHHTAGVWAAKFSPDSSKLVTADRKGAIAIWSVESGSADVVLPGREKSAWSVGFLPDGKSFFVADDVGVVIRDTLTGEVRREFTANGDRITHADLSGDGMLLAAVSAAGRLYLWDVETGNVVHQISVDDDVVWSVVFSPDSKTVAAATSDEVVAIYDVATGAAITELTGHAGGAMDLTFLASGVTLAVVDRLGQLHLWDTITQHRLSRPIQAHERSSWRISAHPDGTQFVSTGDDGHAKLWSIFSKPENCSMMKTAFDADRQLQYLGNLEKPIACTP